MAPPKGTRSPKFRDLTGQRFGRLVVLSRAENNKHGVTQWLCQCTCGNQKSIATGQLNAGQLSCGCLIKERATKHGGSRSLTYRRYIQAQGRTRDTRVHSSTYKSYHERGIEFQFKSFKQFFAELGECPPGMTIDRIDNNGHYAPGNVRWATPKQQANNTRRNVWLTAFGETMTIAQWARKLSLNPITISGRLKRGRPVEEALSQRRRKNQFA